MMLPENELPLFERPAAATGVDYPNHTLVGGVSVITSANKAGYLHLV